MPEGCWRILRRPERLASAHDCGGRDVVSPEELQEGLAGRPTLHSAHLALRRSRPHQHARCIRNADDAPAEHDVGVREGGDLALQLVRGPEVVALQDRNVVTARHLQGDVVGVGEVVDAPVGEAHDPNSGIGVRTDDRLGSVNGAIVDDDLFPARLGLLPGTLQTPPNEALMVVCRRDDGDEGRAARGSASWVPACRCAAAAVRRARAFCHPMAELGSSGLASGLSRKVTTNRNADRGAHASSRRVAHRHRRSEPTSQSARPTQRRAIVALAALPYHSVMSTVATRCCPRQLRLAEPVDGRVPPEPATPRTRRVPPPPLTPRPHTRRATQPFGTR